MKTSTKLLLLLFGAVIALVSYANKQTLTIRSIVPNIVAAASGGYMYPAPPVYNPSQYYPDGCNGNISQFIDNWPGTYSVPRGSESEYIDLGDFHGIKVICDVNGISSYYAVSDPNPKGVEWAHNPSQPLSCSEGTLQLGKWYAIWSAQGYVPHHSYENIFFLRADKVWPTYIRYEGMEGDRYLFQIVGGPSDPMETLTISNPGGVLGCALTDQKYEYLLIPGNEGDSDY
jgi:hypothetical protein